MVSRIKGEDGAQCLFCSSCGEPRGELWPGGSTINLRACSPPGLWVLGKLLRLPREPNSNVHRVLFFARLGGMGGLVVLSFGCAGLYDGISEGPSGEYASPRPFRVIEISGVDGVLEGVCARRMAVENMGKELQNSRGGESGVAVAVMLDMERVLADGEMIVLERCGEDEGEASGNGYSNFVESVANGVPTICDDGECREMSERSASSGIAILVGIELENEIMGSCCGRQL